MPSEPDDAVVEAVARALAVSDGKDPDAPAWVRLPGGHTEGICWRDQYTGKALAAIAAARPLIEREALEKAADLVVARAERDIVTTTRQGQANRAYETGEAIRALASSEQGEGK